MIDVLAVVEERSRLGNALRGPRFSTLPQGFRPITSSFLHSYF